MYPGELAEQHVCKMQDNGARGNGTLCRRITQLGGGELRDTTGVGEGTLYVSVEFIYRAGVWGKPNVKDEQRMRVHEMRPETGERPGMYETGKYAGDDIADEFT